MQCYTKLIQDSSLISDDFSSLFLTRNEYFSQPNKLDTVETVNFPSKFSIQNNGGQGGDRSHKFTWGWFTSGSRDWSRNEGCEGDGVSSELEGTVQYLHKLHSKHKISNLSGRIENKSTTSQAVHKMHKSISTICSLVYGEKYHSFHNEKLNEFD